MAEEEVSIGEVSTEVVSASPEAETTVLEIPTSTEASISLSPEPQNPPVSETPTAQVPVDEPLAPTVEPLKQVEVTEIPKQVEVVTVASLSRSLLTKAWAMTQSRKRKKLDKVMGLFVKKATVTNDDVEKLLHVSDATATRYLSILEKEGKIQQTGKTGRGVSYKKI
ncbi:MAG: hypothetical protein KBC17_01345, partial [Candidatus Pacebacteria bacterium]|nr:hypothetical protein [Candidatus Paceibacterota bacterium]